MDNSKTPLLANYSICGFRHIEEAKKLLHRVAKICGIEVPFVTAIYHDEYEKTWRGSIVATINAEFWGKNLVTLSETCRINQLYFIAIPRYPNTFEGYIDDTVDTKSFELRGDLKIQERYIFAIDPTINEKYGYCQYSTISTFIKGNISKFQNLNFAKKNSLMKKLNGVMMFFEMEEKEIYGLYFSLEEIFQGEHLKKIGSSSSKNEILIP